jgi:hypothetical protein
MDNINTKFEILDIKLLSTFCHNLESNKDCTICRANLNNNSLFAQEKGIESYIVFGICKHAFHYECIESWIKTTKKCPICFKAWEYKKN